MRAIGAETVRSQAETSTYDDEVDEITRLARPEIVAMRPYSSARDENDDTSLVALDANENPYPPYPGDEYSRGLNRYPDPQPARLVKLFADHCGVSASSVLLTRGADEGIDLLHRVFCPAGVSGVVVTPPTFGMYAIAATIQGARVHAVPLIEQDAGFQLDLAGIVKTVKSDRQIRLVFLCSPGNPTGGLLDQSDMIALIDAVRDQALVVVDETYVDFSGTQSLAAELPQHPTLVILRTLSKEYSLAGVRCGATIAHPSVIDLLRRIIAPYALTVPSVRAAIAALEPDGVAYAQGHIAAITQERNAVAAALASMPGVEQVYRSDANFLLVRVADAALLMSITAQAGIKIRDRSSEPGLTNCVRISIGLPEENQRLLAAVRVYSSAVAE